jgi:hypothetical protein
MDLEATKRTLIKSVPVRETFSPSNNIRSMIKSRTPKEENLISQKYSHSYEEGVLNSSLENANQSLNIDNQ